MEARATEATKEAEIFILKVMSDELFLVSKVEVNKFEDKTEGKVSVLLYVHPSFLHHKWKPGALVNRKCYDSA